MRAIILAGGLGTRLRHHTVDTPKPLVRLDGMPIVEIILRQLAGRGFDRVTLALFHMADRIRAELGDGADLGLNIDYSVADRLLGTAGPLGLIDRPTAPCLVLNADILTNIDFGDVMARHRRDPAIATMVLCPYRSEVPFGVIEVDHHGAVESFREKPAFDMQINTGIYVLDPAAWDKVPPGEYLEMNSLIERGLAKDRRIATFVHQGDWLDVGTVESYQRGDRIFREHRALYLPNERERATTVAAL
jgi:NDP-sugar pyrophosphorylase family protein